jgi:uncharacterized DUF497 family protein
MVVRFVWDPNKAESNLRKHGLSFPVASRVFADPLRWTGLDRVVDGEERWLTIGEVASNRILVVAHTVGHDENAVETIRIISARKAEPFERRRYERGDDEV